MLPAELTVAIDLYKASDAAVGSLWGLYSGASLALLGYILGSKSPVPGRAKIGLAAIFAVFASSNAWALWRAQSIGYAATFVIRDFRNLPHIDVPPSIMPLLCQLRVSSPQRVVGFQLFLTLCALGAVYAGHVHDMWVKKHPDPKSTS
jgi:hypothetical protein